MLLLGLTGGIGAGKSTVSRVLGDYGAIVVDADQLARAVLARGTPGLRETVARFGAEILSPDGDLDRAAMASRVFADPEARSALEAITHPRIAAAAAAAFSAAPPGSVVVYDMPLLVEKNLIADYHLVLVVHAEADERLRRLVDIRGMSSHDARARMAAQASDEDRRRAADIWIDNTGAEADTVQQLTALWSERFLPYAHNLAAGRRAERPLAVNVVPPDPSWPDQARRAMARIRAIAGRDVLRLDHVGSTAVPGLPAKDILDLQLVVRDLDVADDLRERLASKGFIPLAGSWWDELGDGTTRDKRLHVAADPGRALNLHIRDEASPVIADQLAFRDWLIAHPDQAGAYAEVKREAAHPDDAATSSGVDIEAYMQAKGAWVSDGVARARAWAASRCR